MKTIGMAAAAFLVACGASAAHGAFERGGNTKDSSADEIAKYEAVAGLPRDPNEKTVEPPKGMKIFLLMGQSNMAGRAKPLDADRIPAPNAYKMNRDDKWSPATPPLHYDKKVAGYGHADAFIRVYLAEHPGESVGVIPCAVGGSSIKSWGNGANHLEVAVRRLKAALPYGEIAGVLWHQGETDALKMDEARYKELFAQMAARVRKEAGRDVPIVVGEIGRFMETESVLVDAEELWMRYDGWGFGADECHAGYAVLK